MNYRVVIQPRALINLREQHRYIAASSPTAADRWFHHMIAALEGLGQHPHRCPVARESEAAGREIRQLLVGKRGGIRRVYFVISSEAVHVLLRASCSAERCIDGRSSGQIGISSEHQGR